MLSNEMKKETKELNLAWSYYQLLLNLRLKYSQFFIIFSTFLAGGFLTILQENSPIHLVFKAVIGILLMVFSFVFAGIDKRNKKCREHVQKIIEGIENDVGYSEPLKLSKMIDPDDPDESKKGKETFFLSKIIYRTFLVLGALILVVALVEAVLTLSFGAY